MEVTITDESKAVGDVREIGEDNVPSAVRDMMAFTIDADEAEGLLTSALGGYSGADSISIGYGHEAVPDLDAR